MLAYKYIYLLLINVFLFLLMGIDKRRAIKNKYRIPEKHLLFLGLIGGGIGGLIGQKIFRHKTKKWFFYFIFLLGVIMSFIMIEFWNS